MKFKTDWNVKYNLSRQISMLLYVDDILILELEDCGRANVSIINLNP